MKLRTSLFSILCMSLLLTSCGTSENRLDENGNPIQEDFQQTVQEAPVTSEGLTKLVSRIKEKSDINWDRDQRSALKWENKSGTFDLYDGYRYQGTGSLESIKQLMSIFGTEGFTDSPENNYKKEGAEKKSFIHKNGYRCALTSKDKPNGDFSIELSCAE